MHQQDVTARAPRAFGGFDLVGLAFGGVSLLWSAVVVLRLQPGFAALFDDLKVPIPAVTALMLKPWFQLLLGGVPLGVVIEGIVRRADRRGRAVRMVVAIVLTLALPAIFLAGLCLTDFPALISASGDYGARAALSARKSPPTRATRLSV